MDKTLTQLQAELDAISSIIDVSVTAFNSPNFKATIVVSGTDVYNSRFHYTMEASRDNPELVKFFELIGSNAYAKKLLLEKQLEIMKVESEV